MDVLPDRFGAVDLDRSFQFGSGRPAFMLLATIQLTLILAITVMVIGLPAVQRELGLHPGQLAMVSAGYGLAFSGLLLLGGRLTDLLGARRVLRIGLITFGIGTSAAGVAPTFASLLGARLVQGAGAALAAPAAMALLGSVFPDPKRHDRAVALWGGLAPIGATSGIVLSGITVAWASWRLSFVVPAVVAALALAASRRVLPDGDGPVPGRLDVRGAVLATTGVSALSYGLVTAGDRGWTSTAALAALVISAVALAGFLAAESRARDPLVPLSFLRAPRRAAALAAVMLMAAGHASIGFFLPLYLQQVRDLSAPATTAAFVPFLVPLPVAGMLAARLGTRMPASLIAAMGLGLGSVGLVLIGQIGLATPYAGALLGGLLLFPIGAGLTFSGGTTLAVQGVERSRAGVAGGLVNNAVELGPTVGLAVLVAVASTRTNELLHTGSGPAAAATGGYRFAFIAAAAAFAVAAAALVAVGRRETPNATNANSEHSAEPRENP